MAKTRKVTPAHSGLGWSSLTYGRRLLLLACVFVLMMVLAGSAASIAGIWFKPGTRSFYIATSLLQNLIGFCGTAFVTALFLSTKPMAMLGLNRAGSWRAVGGIALVFAVGIPLLNQVAWWNEQMHFPGALAGFEQTLRSWENSALQVTDTMLASKSVGALIVNILVIGVFTGFSEELCFRGTMQRVIGSGGMGGHAAVWITAVIFSFLHFQFFGFLPRVLLGAFFGYLFLWTGSIYISACAHALNNSLCVLFAWLVANGMSPIDFDGIGITRQGFPVFACLSLALVLFIMIGMRGYLFSSKKL